VATRDELPWFASSRGLRLNPQNAGSVSADALSGLAERGIRVEHPVRAPCRLEINDLASAQVVVALKEAEHRPLLRDQFPGWEDRVEYWHIHDVDCAHPRLALAELEAQVLALASRCRGC
jgi:protein-tyrosine phosphatase